MTSSRLRHVICALLAIALLVLQITGLHIHRHVELVDGQHGHGVQLHFEDIGIHGNAETHHRHDGFESAGDHVDVETRALDAGALKPILKLPMLALFVVIGLLGLALRRQVILFPPRERPPQRPPRRNLRPPSHAPPLRRLIVV